MTLTVELPAPLEQRIRDRAAQLGGDPETIVANLVADISPRKRIHCVP